MSLTEQQVRGTVASLATVRAPIAGCGSHSNLLETSGINFGLTMSAQHRCTLFCNRVGWEAPLVMPFDALREDIRGVGILNTETLSQRLLLNRQLAHRHEWFAFLAIA
mmetsp:Transcript_25061/g.49033  ORF Transcript_25061/g.49033 Transcript_25061/m.49033 type:complete len:108 (+) Transcript_25061:1361-1684(+)